MATLLLRLAGPLQSWGSSSRFTKRMTEKEPTKSGVLGLIGAALGRRRDEPISDLQQLKFGVRVDQPGQLVRDFHTAHSSDGSQAFVSHRYYLSDAVFVVGLEGDGVLLQTIKEALGNPYFPLSLGRRSCPPSLPIVLEIKQGLGLCEALGLTSTPWMPSAWYRKKMLRKAIVSARKDKTDNASVLSLELAYETNSGDNSNYLLRDEPLTFNQSYRQYGFREVQRERIEVPLEMLSEEALRGEAITTHDPLKELEVV